MTPRVVPDTSSWQQKADQSTFSPGWIAAGTQVLCCLTLCLFQPPPLLLLPLAVPLALVLVRLVYFCCHPAALASRYPTVFDATDIDRGVAGSELQVYGMVNVAGGGRGRDWVLLAPLPLWWCWVMRLLLPQTGSNVHREDNQRTSLPQGAPLWRVWVHTRGSLLEYRGVSLAIIEFYY